MHRNFKYNSMKILPYAMLLAAILLSSCEEEMPLNAELNSQFSIHSIEKGKTYPIWVQLPDDYYLNTEKYSTIYVLDAKDNQEYVAQSCRDISKRLQMRNVIVVGIGYGDERETDYTPTNTSMGNGESLEFLKFIKNELVPRIENDYRAAPDRNSRIILGHSFGGLCGAYAFTNFNDLFGNYLLLSSSLFYDNDIVMQYEQAIRPQIKNEHQSVYIGAGGTEGPLLVDNDLLYRRLNAHYSHSKATFTLIEGKGHNSSKNPNIEKGINFYFKNR